MTGSRARLFTVGVGSEVDAGDARPARPRRRRRVAARRRPEQAVVRALELSGALKTPTITDLEVDLGEGLDDMFISSGGKLSRGQEMVMLARTHHDLPDKITISGRLAGEAFERGVPPGPRPRRARPGRPAPVGRRLRRAPARRLPRRRGRARQDPLARPRVRDDDPLHLVPRPRQRVRLRSSMGVGRRSPQLRRRQAHRRQLVDARR
jgi:hypothetical protein